jgi:hypothetical protein
VKVGDLVRHKTFGHTGLIVGADPRHPARHGVGDYFLIVWSDWRGLPQKNNQTWALERDMEVINGSR